MGVKKRGTKQIHLRRQEVWGGNFQSKFQHRSRQVRQTGNKIGSQVSHNLKIYRSLAEIRLVSVAAECNF